MASGDDPSQFKSWIEDRTPGFFLGVSFTYFVVLIVLLLARRFHWMEIEDLPRQAGGIIPLAIPWFGALGAVMVSWYGVFDHNSKEGDKKWDRTYAYWHLLRPFSGAVLGTIAYLIFIGFINASTSKDVSPLPKNATEAIPYLVIAFVVGFREDTFRSLIKRVVDMIIGPGIPGVTPPVGITIKPSPISFPDTKLNQAADSIEVTVINSGTGSLVVHGVTDTPKGIELTGDGVFSLEHESLSGAVLLANAQGTLAVAFTPTEEKSYSATLKITSNAGTTKVSVAGKGVKG